MTEVLPILITHELRAVMACGAKPGEEVPKQDPKQDPADPQQQPTEAEAAPARPMPRASRG
jgi:hypothetical protein